LLVVVYWDDCDLHSVRSLDSAALGDLLCDAWAGAALPEGRRVYRVVGGDRVVVGWRQVRRWSMADGTPLAALWVDE